MVAKQQAASRHGHLPTARGAHDGATASVYPSEPRRTSETRLQAAVSRAPARDDLDPLDPYADVPCTD